MIRNMDLPTLQGISRISAIVIVYVSAGIYTGMNNQDLIIAIIAAYVGFWLHEGSHYFAGWLGKSDPRMVFRVVIPEAVEHRRIETMDSVVIRLSGLSVFLWIPLFVLTIFGFLLLPSPETLIMTIPFGISTLMMTTSDSIALLEPERHRELEEADEIPLESLWGLH